MAFRKPNLHPVQIQPASLSVQGQPAGLPEHSAKPRNKRGPVPVVGGQGSLEIALSHNDPGIGK